MTAYLLAVAVLGALLSGPAWMAYALRQERERREWDSRRKAKEMRR